MRDKIKNRAYFDDLIELNKSLINTNNDKLAKNLVKSDRIKIVKRLNSSYYKNIIIGKYSRGDNMFEENVYENYKQALFLFYENWENGEGKYAIRNKKQVVILDQYVFSKFLSVTEMISLGILLEIPDNDFELLVDYIERDQVKDFLIESLLRYRKSDREEILEENYQKFFHVNERYGRLKTIVQEQDKELAQKELRYFLENEWYQSFKDTPLYDQHKNPHNTYLGYWCFTAAAIVKIKQLDDSSFRNNPYYPKDFI